jgi:hypothetical protein
MYANGKEEHIHLLQNTYVEKRVRMDVNSEAIQERFVVVVAAAVSFREKRYHLRSLLYPSHQLIVNVEMSTVVETCGFNRLHIPADLKPQNIDRFSFHVLKLLAIPHALFCCTITAYCRTSVYFSIIVSHRTGQQEVSCTRPDSTSRLTLYSH